MLEDEEQERKAAIIIHEMKTEAQTFAPDWVSLATTPDRPKNTTLAALRGLAAIGDGAQPHAEPIRVGYA
jgi:hypothetical protein